MCFERPLFKIQSTVLVYIYILASIALVQCQRYSSPCPDTFQYEQDRNGELTGTIGVYTLNANVVILDLELSVGNEVTNYNGRIQLAYSKNQVTNDIRRGKPIMYKVYFPRWQNVPPKVTKISVNGQVVCRGPPLQLGGFINFLTTINLQHTFTIKSAVTTLGSGNSFNPNGNSGFVNNFVLDLSTTEPNEDEFPKKGFSNNPFLSGGNSNNQFGFNGGGNQNTPFLSGGNQNTGGKWFSLIRQGYPNNDYRNIFVDYLTSTTERNFYFPRNDFVYSRNPFLGNSPDVVTRVDKVEPPTVPTTSKPKPLTNPPRISSTSSNQCGTTVLFNPLVINGFSVQRREFPWLVAMFVQTNTGLDYRCCGNLVSKKHVVTAAHCLYQGRKLIPKEKLVLILGKLNLKKWSDKGSVTSEISDIKVNPRYVPVNSDTQKKPEADIAVVALSEEVEFTEFIRPICLWSEDDDLDNIVNQVGTVVGWGRDENGSNMTGEPRQVSIPIVSQERCLRSAEAFKFITSNTTFCAGSRNNSGPCNGDSGSGFIMKRNGLWTLRGVVSTSTYDTVKETCDLTNYVVFTDVSKFRTWLFSIIST